MGALLPTAAPHLDRLFQTVGGLGGCIVLADADLDVAVDGAVAGNFQNAGQVCISGSRVLVARSIHDEFVNKLEQRVRSLRLGYQLIPGTQMGPLASAKHLEAVHGYVELGKKEGAKLLLGGKRASVPGFDHGCFYEPTVFVGVKNSMRIAREEIFGPVLVVIPFDDDDDAVALANDTAYGLAGAVWSRDVSRAQRLARRVHAGTMWVNDVAVLADFVPFGGYKESGIGREFGDEGLKAYTQTKVIYTSNEATSHRGTFGSVVTLGPNPSFRFHQPTKLVVGPKSVANLYNELRLLGAKRAVIITDGKTPMLVPEPK